MISKSDVIKRGYKYLTRKELAIILDLTDYELSSEIDQLGLVKNKPWSNTEEKRLIDLYENSNEKISAIASIMQRSNLSIKGRLRILRKKGEIGRRNRLTSATQ